jgi:hypothetical protein
MNSQQVFDRAEALLHVYLIQGLIGYVIGLGEVETWSDELLLSTFRNLSRNYPALEAQVLSLSFQEKQEKLKEMVQQQRQRLNLVIM